MMIGFRWFPFSCGVVLACTSSPDDPATTQEETDTTDAGACACAVDGCQESLCPTIVLDLSDGESEGTGGQGPEVDAALTCALEALRDGSVGEIHWSTSSNAGQYSEDGSVQIRGDGTAVRRSIGVNDLCFDEVGEIAVGQLAAAASFADCIDIAGVVDRLDCIRSPFVGMLEICREREEFCEF